MSKVEFLTPVGRLVEGDCFKPNTTDAEGNPLKIKSGPNAGQDRVEFYMGLAIPKNDPNVEALRALVHQTAREAFPNLFDAAGNCLKPGFAFKYTDGDSIVPNSRGTRPCDKEGYPGNWVFRLSGGFAPKVYMTGGKSVIVDPEQLKRGYYIRIYGSVGGNGSTQQPGVFLNHSMIEFIAYGEAITSGPDGAAVFGGAPAPVALPAGATLTPPAPNVTIAPPVAAFAAPAPVAAVAAPAPVAAFAAPAPVAAVAAPAPVAAVAAPSPVAVVPAPDFLNPAPVVETFIASGAQYTREQLTGFGWTADQINALPRA